jgi:hypothetical protein
LGRRRIDGRGCEVNGRSQTVAEWMDEMITISANGATCALLQLINDLGELDAANAHFAELGLDTLRMYPAQPDVGAVWLAAPARMSMGALDTAKLTVLLAGSQRQLWRGPDGKPVTERVLSASSRDFLRGLLAEQGFHEVLSTGLLCGSTDTVAGIPALVPERFIDPDTGIPEWSSSSGWWVIGRRLSGAVGAEPQPGSQASSADSSPLRSRSRTRSPYGLQLRPDCIHSSNVGAAEDVGENPSRTMHSWITTNPS